MSTKQDISDLLKPVLLICAFFLSACHQTTEKIPNVKPLPIDHTDSIIAKHDRVMSNFERSLSFLDSNLKYGHLADQMTIKMNKTEADYYRTGDEKYYRLWFRLQKRQWTYVGLCNRYNDSLTAVAKTK